MSVTACTSLQPERGEKRPTGRDVAEEAGQATDAADRDDLVLYSTSIEDEEETGDEPVEDEPVEDEPVEDEPAADEDVDEQEPAADEDVDEQEPVDDDPSDEPAGEPAQE